jgi:ATPase family associated with various cellular activities (AAA)
MMSETQSADANSDSQSVLIESLRQLRKDAQRVNSGLVERLFPFRKPNKSFKTLATSELGEDSEDKPDISVASTCTVLMAALGFEEDNREKLLTNNEIASVFKVSVEKGKWASSRLTDGNAFTTAMLIRCAGFVVEQDILKAEEVLKFKHKKVEPDPQSDSSAKAKRDIADVDDKTVNEIIISKAKDPENGFAVMEYPAKSTHGYWFVDGAARMKVPLGKEIWQGLANWASKEFHRQLTYVSAGNDALMDPPALAMAACLISRIRGFTEDQPDLAEVARSLPSSVELEFGTKQVFSTQSNSGIWHKYFPLFHFPGGKGAADYCFSFEFLEAILNEFGAMVLRDGELLERVRRAVQWCDKHELVFTDATGVYRGWNAGGEVRNLEVGMAESWATATVHMFLTILERRIDDVLDELVLRRFGLNRGAVSKPNKKKFEDLIDVEVKFPFETPSTTLRTVLEDELLKQAAKLNSDDLRPLILSVPRSVLLFGPPGTSKSRLAKAIAEYLGWPFIVVTPSEFLGKGLEQVHAEVDALFRDLVDLRKVVVFFDEMDALAQTREGDDFDVAKTRGLKRVVKLLKQATEGTRPSGGLDVTRQLLTTSMLPKLASLWDRKRVIFLMATNHKQQLDPAITRPNRFDLLLCVAPPAWKKKREATNLHKALSIADATEVENELLRLVPDGSAGETLLDRFTVAEVGIFLHHLCQRTKQAETRAALKQYQDPAEFAKQLEDWAATSITLRTKSRTLEEFEKDFNESRRQYYPGEK